MLAPPVSASIVVSGSNGPRPVVPTSVPTDAQGRFVIQNVDAGGYRIAVAANGYARQDYGQKSFGTSGTVITVAAGQALKDIVVRMTPAGNVTGRISDGLGRPAVGAQVQLLRTSYNPSGQKQFQAAGTAKTNDRGEYNMRGITPGDYKLFAWEALEQFAYFDSDVVEKFESQAKPVHVTESSKLTLEVSVIRE